LLITGGASIAHTHQQLPDSNLTLHHTSPSLGYVTGISDTSLKTAITMQELYIVS